MTKPEEVLRVSVESIQVNPHQPRDEKSDEMLDIQGLAQTIKSVGLLQPPIVRLLGNNLYELIAGERRFRAAKAAGLKKIPVIVREATPYQSALAALIENIQRVNLDPIENAKALKRMVEEFNLTHEELATYLGLKRTSLSNQIRLLSLPQKIQGLLMQKKISLGHAKVILALENPKDQLVLAEMILRDDLSVRETEKKIQQFDKVETRIVKKKTNTRNIFLEQVKDNLQKKYGTKIEVHGSEESGSLQFSYYSLSDLNRLLTCLGYLEE